MTTLRFSRNEELVQSERLPPLGHGSVPLLGPVPSGAVAVHCHHDGQLSLSLPLLPPAAPTPQLVVVCWRHCGRDSPAGHRLWGKSLRLPSLQAARAHVHAAEHTPNLVKLLLNRDEAPLLYFHYCSIPDQQNELGDLRLVQD